MPDQWDAIPKAATPGGRAEMLADPGHPLDFYRGRDFDGRHLFWLSVEWPGGDLPRCPTIAGMDVDCRPEGDRHQLCLTLRDAGQLEVFRALCANLMDATRALVPGAGREAMLAVIARLRRWQELLGKRRQDLLTRQQIIGLMGELLFLRDHVLTHLAPGESVISWRGPYSDEQDFVFGDRIVEVKTQLATADRRLQISSEHQLDTTSGPIALVHQLLGSGAGEPGARSLNEMVHEIAETLAKRSLDALDLFNAGLSEVGYVARAEYDAEQWVPAGARSYEILDGFPRLVASALPPGVSHVRYDISPAECAAFERPADWIGAVVCP